MPVFADLDIRVNDSPFDRAAYDRRLPVCHEVARRMALVHVTGGKRALEATIVRTPQEIPTSSDPGYCTEDTRSAEDLLGMPRCVYFYAGRAHPAFGNAAIAFPAECESKHAGSATPFDTGGLVHRNRYLKVRLDPTDGPVERVEYGRASEIPFGASPDWREIFAQVLAAYFETPLDYWTGRPFPPDPEELYRLNDEWRAWTFEVRFHEPQPLAERAAWCADEAVMDRLRQLEAAEPPLPPGDPPSPLAQFLAGPVPLEPRGTPQFSTRIEQWVREQVGL